MQLNALGNFGQCDQLELFELHDHSLFGQCAMVQVDMGLDDSWALLQRVRSLQQQGAKITGVFKVVRMQLKAVALFVDHFTSVIRFELDHSLENSTGFYAHVEFNARLNYLRMANANDRAGSGDMYLSIMHPDVLPHVGKLARGLGVVGTDEPVLVIKTGKEIILTAREKREFKLYLAPCVVDGRRGLTLISAFFDDPVSPLTITTPLVMAALVVERLNGVV